MRQITVISHAEAHHAIETMRAEVERRGKAAVLTVTDNHGELMALLRMDGAPFSSVIVATNKAYTSARERRPSSDFGPRHRDPERGFPMTNFGELRFVTWGGGLPIMVDGVVVGAVGVSGMRQEEDVEVAEIGRQSILANN